MACALMPLRLACRSTKESGASNWLFTSVQPFPANQPYAAASYHRTASGWSWYSLFCDKCGQRCAARKGLTYHMLRDRGVSMGKRDSRRTAETYEFQSSSTPEDQPPVNSEALQGIHLHRGAALLVRLYASHFRYHGH
ncbi:hypothetical protein TNCV_2757251 [Trichonephila clavipes]|nr:hypothetical protein TNCV_2757251 [Trichonephila clavipes]